MTTIPQGRDAPEPVPASGGDHFHALLDQLPAAAYTCDPQGLITFYNQQAKTLWGRAPELNDATDRYCGSFKLYGADGTAIEHDQCWMAKALQEKVGFNEREIVIERPDGSQIHALAHANPIHDESGRVLGAVNILVDISNRTRIQSSFRNIVEAVAPTTGKNFFRALATHLSETLRVDNVLIGVWDAVSPDQIRTIANSHRGELGENVVYQLAGTPCENVAGKALCYYPTGVKEAFPDDELLTTLDIDSYMGTPLSSSQGTPLGLIALMHHRPIDDPEQAKAILQVVAARTAAEIERERAEEALRTSENRYAGLVNNVDGIVWEMDAVKQRFRFVSRQAARILGFPVSRWLDEANFWHNHVHPDDRDRAVAHYADCRKRGLDHEFEYRMIAADGREVWFHELVSVEAGDQGPVTLRGMMLDITERKRAEEERRVLEAQLQHAQKLESLGVLAGGIAHDFNNLLTSILGNADLAVLDLPDDSPAVARLQEIADSAHRSAELTRQMLAYAGKGTFEIRPFRIDELVQEMTNLLQMIVSKKATVELDVAPATVEGDATQVRQVVMNLITNASDALGDDTGLIRIRTGVRFADSAELRSSYYPEHPRAGRYAYIEVEDTGHGIREDALERIFDPFFSTKFTGRGLGLAATLGIVRGHRGAINVRSTVGGGTTFSVLFPCAESGTTPPTARRGDTGLPRGEGTVLVIEDEPAVRDLAKSTLERIGCHVLTAEDGAVGLDVFARHGDGIDAILLDVTMPRLDGLQVLQEIRRTAPDLPVIVMSGYSQEDVATRFEGNGASAFIHKPFRPKDLMTRICEIVSSQ